MSHNQPTVTPSTEPETVTRKAKSGRFRQVFWPAFLVVSLAYAWYSFYAPSNRIAWADSFTAAQQQAVESDKPCPSGKGAQRGFFSDLFGKQSAGSSLPWVGGTNRR